jgi:hypothetical protein
MDPYGATQRSRRLVSSMLGRGSPSLQARSTPTLRSARGVHVSRNGSVVIGGTQAALPPAAAAGHRPHASVLSTFFQMYFHYLFEKRCDFSAFFL